MRKCRHFDGFRTRVVSPEVLPELEELADEVSFLKSVIRMHSEQIAELKKSITA